MEPKGLVMQYIPLEMWFLIIGASIFVSSLITFICYKKIFDLIWAQRIKNRNLLSKNFTPIIEELSAVLKEAETFSINFSKFLEERKEILLSYGRRREDDKKEIVAQRADNMETYSPTAKSFQQKASQIHRLASAGWGVADIAWQLGLSREEVQLILNLSRNGGN